MQTSVEPNSNLTLAQINQRLQQFSLPVIRPEKIKDVLANSERDRLIRAINALDKPEAMKYVKNSLVAAQIIMVNDAPAEPELQGYPNDDDQARGRQDDNNLLSDRAKFHVYGGKAALCFEADITRGNVPTIALDAANTTGPRTYNWGQKTRIQMTRAELPVVAAVLLGARQSCEFSAHGVDKSKGFSMERQAGGKIFTKVFEKGQSVKAVPIEAADTFFVASLFLLQLRKISPWLDASSAIALVRTTMYMDSKG